MALLCSPNKICCYNPRHLRNPNFKFNQSQFSLKFSENYYYSFSFSANNRKLRRRRWIFCASGEDPPQSGLEDDEVNDLGVKTALSMLRFYKREISPLLPRSCRYVPTCSEYSMIAYKKYGFAKGTILTAWRVCRCNPLGGSGFDPPRWFDETTPPEQ